MKQYKQIGIFGSGWLALAHEPEPGMQNNLKIFPGYSLSSSEQTFMSHKYFNHPIAHLYSSVLISSYFT